MASQNKRFKNSFLTSCPSLTGSKRNTVVKATVNSILREPLQANNRLMHLSFAFLRSASLSPEVVKELSKLRLVEDIQAQLENVCKSEKDIKLLKSFLCHYSGFLAAYAFSDEG
jgi:ribosomal protein L10